MRRGHVGMEALSRACLKRLSGALWCFIVAVLPELLEAMEKNFHRYSRQRVIWPDVVLLALTCAVAAWFVVRAQEVLPRQWEWGRLLEYLVWHDAAGWHAGLLFKGVCTTLRLGVWAGILAMLVGICVGAGSAGRRGWAALPAQIFVTLLRNTPPLVLLFLIYLFASEQLFGGLNETIRALSPEAREMVAVLFADAGQIDRMAAAVLTLGVYEGAYVAEIVRAGLESVPRGQWDAGAALGFPNGRRLRLIIFPQALPLMLPPLAGQCISTFKESALAALISVPELTFQGMEVMSVTRRPFEAWLVVGLLYLLLSLGCAAVFRHVERRAVWR